jgi:hypothetical protein
MRKGNVMLNAWRMANSFYITTTDGKGHKHHYRLNAQEVGQSNPLAWEDEALTRMDAPTYKFAAIISDESARKLWEAVH